jgi:hypothetical protein
VLTNIRGEEVALRLQTDCFKSRLEMPSLKVRSMPVRTKRMMATMFRNMLGRAFYRMHPSGCDLLAGAYLVSVLN